jgi:hypothetical protein
MDDSSRKQFEEKFSYLDLTRDWGISDFYDDNKTQSAWEAWQAGRASMRDEAADKEELAMMIRMLASSLKKHWPYAQNSGDLPSRAIELLKKHGLQGSPLRSELDDFAPKQEIQP